MTRPHTNLVFTKTESNMPSLSKWQQSSQVLYDLTSVKIHYNTPSICDEHFCEINLRTAWCACHFAWHLNSWNAPNPWIHVSFTAQYVSAVHRILVIISSAGSAITNSYVHRLFFALQPQFRICSKTLWIAVARYTIKPPPICVLWIAGKDISVPSGWCSL